MNLFEEFKNNYTEGFAPFSISNKSRRVAETITRGILLEVACTPKPGLVDRNNNGAHNDMTYYSFMQGSAAIASFLADFTQLGFEWKENVSTLDELLPFIRIIGLRAEEAMYRATNGVNTQKGLLFTAGLTGTAAGVCIEKRKPLTMDSISQIVARITEGIVERELRTVTEKTAKTAGEKWYVQGKHRGIRGEVEDGFPSVQLGVIALEEALAQKLSLNDSMVHALFTLMSMVDDTTILNRHNETTLIEVQEVAQQFIESGSVFKGNWRNKLLEMDRMFIQRNISPGGSADLLAITVACYFLDPWHSNEK